MRRTIAGTAATVVTVLAIGAPLASAAHAAPATLECAGGGPAACELLDDLAAQLGPVAPLLGPALTPLTEEAQDLAVLSDQPGGVATADVVAISETLLDELEVLPAPVQSLVGAARLNEVTDTLEALVDTLTAVSNQDQESSSGSTPTPSRSTSSSGTSAPVSSTRGADATAAGSASSGESTSSAGVPDVPVGDPLALAPLDLPDFGFDPSFAPAVIDAAAPSSDEAALAVADPLGGEGSRTVELIVVAVLSLLLLSGAGIAQLQANRHQIPA